MKTMMTFSVGIKKHKLASVGRARGHNERLHATESQLPRSAWFAGKPAVVLVQWDQGRLDAAREMMTRKDAVVGIELSIQIGNQLDWRELPSKQHPHGRPKKPPADLKALVAAAVRAAKNEFGADNVISAALHLDESTPHVQIIVTPIHAGKLQAKHWLNGAAKCAALTARLHAEISKSIPCAYTPGSGAGGKPHDAGKRAGAVQPKGTIDRVIDAIGQRSEIEKSKAERDRALQNEQAAFARAKAAAIAAEKAAKAAAEAEKKAADDRRAADAAKAQLAAVQLLLPAPETPPPVSEVLARVCDSQRLPDGSYRVGRDRVTTIGQRWHVLGVMQGQGAIDLLQRGLKIAKDAAESVKTLLQHFTPGQVAGWLRPPPAGGGHDRVATVPLADPSPVRPRSFNAPIAQRPQPR